jgi:Ohr subfamily peroxiredoxin
MATVTSINYRTRQSHPSAGAMAAFAAPTVSSICNWVSLKSMGGTGGKTNPEEPFAAGYAACFHTAVKRVAADKKVPIGKSMVKAHVGLGHNDNGTGFMLGAEQHVILLGAYAEVAKDVVRGAHMICFYTAAHFERVVRSNHGITFREQAEIWLEQMKNRKRKPVAPSTLENWEHCLRNWLNPNIGDMPLDSIGNLVSKNLGATMVKGGLGASAIRSYTNAVKIVVA